MAHDIFISYSNKDKTTADAICAYMESKGLRCWYAPRDIVPGADWANSIIESIGSTKIMILVFTSNSNISSQVLREVSNAVNSGVTIIPFKLTEDEPVQGMKYYLSTLHWLDAMNEDLSIAIDNLYALCKSVIEAKDSSNINDDMKKQAEKVEAEKKAKALKKKKTIIAAFVTAIVVILIVVLAIVLGGSKEKGNVQTPDTSNTSETIDGGTTVTFDSVSMDPTETYTDGNNQGNLQSGGYLACDGEYYYYRSNDKHSLYKMKVDGSEKTKLSYEPAGDISVYEGYVYYYSSSSDPMIKRMKTDGTDMKILHMGPCEDVRIVDGLIYYRDSQDGLNLYSMSLEGDDVKLVNKIKKPYSWCIDGKYFYYSNQDDEKKVYRTNLDGSDPVCIIDHPVEGMTIAGNYLYFNDMTTNYFSTYDLSTGEIEKICADYIYYINITESNIYGYSGRYNTYLCSMQINGLGEKTLNEIGVNNVCVSGEKIYYYSKDDEQYYICDLDGSNPVLA